MRIRTKEVRDVAAVLDDVITEYKKGREEKERDWKTYEQRLEGRIRAAMQELEPLIDKAASTLRTVKGTERGRQPKLTPKQKTTLLLLKHLCGKSNREMSFMLILFSLLTGVDVSYKTVERLYSDGEVSLVLHNMHELILEKKGVESANCSGDGTGYSLTIKKHYASVAQKLKDKAKEAEELEGNANDAKKMKKKGRKRVFVYSFNLMDLDSRMYVAYGTSFKSEKEAYNRAMRMAEEMGISANAIRLDKYYSGQGTVEQLEEAFGNDVKVYLIPKKNATVGGPWKWKRMLHHFVNDTYGYLEEYFRRNQSESGFSEDKRRFGWRILQRRQERVDTAAFCTVLWHNLFWLG